ncbi:MAG TPA: M23 family metallopeptidase [Vicinamibacterales bacterium]|nr:M23 family metallopeptidase [Vicinamibacterales bacterium]
MRFLIRLVLLLLVIAGVAWFVAGRIGGPTIELTQPEKFLGVATPLEAVIGAPVAQLTGLRVVIEQNGKQFPAYSLGDAGGDVKEEAPGRTRLKKTIGKESAPDLQSGSAKIHITAERPVLYGLRKVSTTATKEVQVRLERPKVAVLSAHHFVNHGGAEVVVYRATPADVVSGVVVGDVEYPGYPASTAGVPGITVADPSVKVAFFALRHDQDLKTPIRVFARDEAGNIARADFDKRVFPKPFKKSRIEVTDSLIDRVVPAILEGTTEIKPDGDNLAKFLAINSELRKKNAEKIASFAKQTAKEMLWSGQVFHTFKNNAVESAFADARTYVYKGKEVDQQTHLGFDLASFTATPIVAANRGKVLFAEELGIYGNCVIVDHGMGVQSLYAHLSSMDVKAGDNVEKAQQIGRSGMTGMAGGDHLHFTMLVNGTMVNPVEWWDGHWIEDRIVRKLREAAAAK